MRWGVLVYWPSSPVHPASGFTTANTLVEFIARRAVHSVEGTLIAGWGFDPGPGGQAVRTHAAVHVDGESCMAAVAAVDVGE